MNQQYQERLPVVFGPGNIVIIGLSDAIKEYFRLSLIPDRNYMDNRIFAALTLALTSVPMNTDIAQQLYNAATKPLANAQGAS